jgi:hypothetical protein
VKSLTWDQINAWRLARHGLAPRVGFMEAVRRMIGVQAQVMSAAELSLCARVDGLRPSDVQTALWQERTLVKTWAMRGTLFLFVAEDLPLVVSTRQIRKARYWVKHFESYGIYEPQYQALLEAIPQVLGDEPMTREQLAVAAAEHTGIDGLLPALTESSWGTALKPSAFRGDLCYGPTQGRNVAFVHPGEWLGSWREIEPEVAAREIIRRYLSVYGPATPQDFGRWWGAGTRLATKMFKKLEEELEAVDVEGHEAFALRSSLEPMESLSTAGVVRLLPMFDAYTHGLEAPPIGWQLFALDSPRRDGKAFVSSLDTYDTRLLAEALNRPRPATACGVQAPGIPSAGLDLGRRARGRAYRWRVGTQDQGVGHNGQGPHVRNARRQGPRRDCCRGRASE